MEINLLVVFFLLFFQGTLQQQHQSVPLISPVERAALLKLRSSLGLRTKDWPIKFEPCLTWIGVLCQDGGVVGINISGFKRTRLGNQNPKFAVDALASFTKLVSFNASGFSLPGSMPNWLGLHLQTLRHLDLRFCEISGAIPSRIGNLSNLTELYLSDNNLNCTIPSTLSLLSHLSVLDLSRNSLTGSIPSCLGSLSNISLLDISSNHLSGAIPQEFGNLSNLQSLNLSHNNLSASIPTQLGNLSRLLILDLSSNSLSGAVPSEFGKLRNLQRMVIQNNNFIGELPAGLWSLPGLSFLDASDNNLMGSLPNHTLNPNATMAVLNLSHNTFYGVLTSVLKRVSSTDLSYNYLQGRIPNYLRHIASLDKNCFRSWQSQRTVKECAGFYSMKGLPFHNFGLPNATLPPRIHDHKVNRRKLILSAILTCFSLILLFVISVTLLIICSYKKRKTTGLGPIPVDSCGFAYEKILAATDEFNNANLVKTGHSGDIFKGIFENGINIVVKRFDVRSGKNKFMVELDFLSKVSHPRLVPLLGHCLDKQKEKFLVYRYMPKGDLSSVLDTKNSPDDHSLNSLDWITRLKIAIGAAECLSYLHHECSPPLVHRDVQASSILLDDKYEVRLGSLSETCIHDNSSQPNRITRTSEEGGPGLQTATCAYDVYCFGKVLLELVTGRMGISASNDSTTTKDLSDNILPYISIYDKELVTNIMDPNLIVDDDLLEEVWAMAAIAKSCLNSIPSRRPVMRFVLKALENPLKVVREKPSKVRVNSSRCSWSASWRRSSADVAGGRERYSSSRRHLKDVVPMGVEEEEVERLNEARVD